MPPGKSMPCAVFINPWEKRIGPNRYLVETLRQLPALAKNSIIILPMEGETAEEYRALGCRVEIFPEARLVHVNLSPLNLWCLLRVHTLGVLKVWRHLKKWHAKIVLTNSENVWFAGIAARLLGVTHLQTFHALTLEYNWGNRPWLARTYVRFLSLFTTRFVAVSQVVAEMLARQGVPASRITLVPNGLNLIEIAQASQTALPPEIENVIRVHSPILVNLGRISHLKGHDLLIEAFAKVKQKFPDALLLCAGGLLSNEGLDDTHAFYCGLQARIDELGLNASIIFLGEIDYGIALLRCTDVYVQPSRSESFCRAVAEAALCRVPVAAFKVGGIPEVLGENGSVLVTPEHASELADVINRLLSDEALRQTWVESAYSHIAECFDVRQTSQRLQSLLSE